MNLFWLYFHFFYMPWRVTDPVWLCSKLTYSVIVILPWEPASQVTSLHVCLEGAECWNKLPCWSSQPVTLAVHCPRPCTCRVDRIPLLFPLGIQQSASHPSTWVEDYNQRGTESMDFLFVLALAWINMWWRCWTLSVRMCLQTWRWYLVSSLFSHRCPLQRWAKGKIFHPVLLVTRYL